MYIQMLSAIDIKNLTSILCSRLKKLNQKNLTSL